jgi:predicted DCC family thiol-disulfide oxidoreductase YuxK
MDTLTVLYDARCNLCSRIRAWLETQPTYMTLEFVPTGSDEARQRFPQLDHAVTTQELTVIDDQGGVYIEANAFLMCLWALRDYRAWSLRLSAPEMIPLARRVVLWVSQNRFRFGTRTLNEILADDEGLLIECADGCSVN